MKKFGKLTLFSENNQYVPPSTKKELTQYRKSFGWMGEDYRQSIVGTDLGKALSKPEEYFPFPFRHISATIVGGGSWKATEFPEAVLKKGVPLLSYKPAFVNHEYESSNIIGVNGKLKWTPKSKDKNGKTIAAGIDGPIWIDGLLHQDITRKLSAYPVPHIQSVSVTIDFEWEPSHEFKNRDGDIDDYEFMRRIGTTHEDGEMIRRIATKIIDGYETSLVWLGADPFAKILDDEGKPLNIERTAVVGMSKYDDDPLKESYEKDKHYFVLDNFSKGEKNTLYLSPDGIIKNVKTENSNVQNKNDMNEIQKYIADLLGVDAETLTVEFLKGFKILKLDQFNIINDKAEKFAKISDYETVKSERDQLKTDKAGIDAKLVEFEKIVVYDKLKELSEELTLESVVTMAKVGQSTITAKREACVKYYKLAVGEEKSDQSVIDLINGADEKAIEGLLKQYGNDSFEKFKGKCEDCDSENVTFRSTVPEKSEGEDDDEGSQPMFERLRN